MKSLFSLVFLTLLFGQQLSSETNDIPPYFVFVNRDSVVVRESPNSTKIASFQQDSEEAATSQKKDNVYCTGRAIRWGTTTQHSEIFKSSWLSQTSSYLDNPRFSLATAYCQRYACGHMSQPSLDRK